MSNPCHVSNEYLSIYFKCCVWMNVCSVSYLHTLQSIAHVESLTVEDSLQQVFIAFAHSLVPCDFCASTLDWRQD